MKKTVPALILLFVSAAFFLSCKKDSSTTKGSSSSISFLTSSRWTFQKFEYEKQDGTWIADPDAVDANQFTIGFNADNTFAEANTVIGGAHGGAWHFSDNNTVLTTTGGYDLPAAAYSVNQLTSSTLELTDPNFKTAAYIAERLTFTH